jgi:segregation and condensation protein A
MMPDETINPAPGTEEANPAKEPGISSVEKANPAKEPGGSSVEEVNPANESGAPRPAVADVGFSLAEDSPAAAEFATPAPPFALEPKPVPPPPEPKRTTASKDAKEKEKEEASQSPFSVTVGLVYDGPLDLLLDLIRKQNIDIYDIPIARITSQFLEYTGHLKQVDVDAAGEFIYMASLLIHIKSKTLLPRDPTDVAGGESEDPRRELVERLLEHERFKAAAQMLLQKQQIEEATWTNPGMKNFRRDTLGADDSGLDQEIAADTVDLVRVFQDILHRMRERPVLDVDEDSVTVAQMIDYVKRRLIMEDRPISLRRLLHNTHTERALICMFLAMLELVRLQAVLLHQPVRQGDILVKKTEAFDQVFADQAQARDDWR